MTAQQMNFTMKMEERDWELYGQFWQYMRRQGINVFTSDNIRFCFSKNPGDLEDEKLLSYFPNPSKDLGAWVAKCKYAGLFIDVGKKKGSVIPSNHGHKNPLYRMRGLEDRWVKAQGEQ